MKFSAHIYMRWIHAGNCDILSLAFLGAKQESNCEHQAEKRLKSRR